MLSIKWIRENVACFEKSLQRRGLVIDTPALLEADQQHRQVLTDLQKLQEDRNAIATQIPQLKKAGEDIAPLLAQAQKLKETIPDLEKKVQESETTLSGMLHVIPNVLDDSVPDGTSEEDNQLIRRVGNPLSFDFTPRAHTDLGEALGLMRFDLAAAMSGSRFVCLFGALARLERALGQFMLNLHTTEFGYQEVSPPLLVREKAAFGVGQLPKFEEDLFKTTSGHYLISTAEGPLTNLASDQIFMEAELPLRYTALTPCFRSEAGSAGRDTHGMIRMHQFYKVELVSFVTPEQAMAEHERMLNAAEEVLKRLELPYQVKLLCSGDIGFQSRKTYDIEVWLPSQNQYREISSCSQFGDYQARRLQGRFRTKEHGVQLLNTLNGSGIAVGRALVAILENFQQADGSILIPKALQEMMGTDRITKGQP